jgi:hypothetical protein
LRARPALDQEYIVIFGGGVAGHGVGEKLGADAKAIDEAITECEAAEKAIKGAGGKILFRYRAAVIGFSANLTPGALQVLKDLLAKSLSAPLIKVNWQVSVPLLLPLASSKAGVMKGAMRPLPGIPLSQGLDRIGQRLLGLNHTFAPPAWKGDVQVYVMDGAILETDPEFADGAGKSRFAQGYDAVGGRKPDFACMKHATHVAGTIGSKHFGVAPAVTLHSVRVMDCSDWVSVAATIAGVDWIAGHHRDLNKAGPAPGVVNVSLDFAAIPAAAYVEAGLPELRRAIENSVRYGITYVVGAGNERKRACDVFPGLIPEVITVGAIDPEIDEFADFSNYGNCVDIFAPGKAVISINPGGMPASIPRNGTSMAAPHVTGVAAIILSTYPGSSPADVWAMIARAADQDGTYHWCGIQEIKRIETGLDGSPNRLLHWGSGLQNGAAVPDGTVDSEPPPSTTPICAKK